MRSSVRLLTAVGVVCLAVSAVRPAHAQIQYGPYLNFASNGVGVGIGGRVQAGLTGLIPTAKNVGAIGALNLYFPTGGTAWGIDLNGTYQFHIPAVKTVEPYVGGGLALIHGISRNGVGLNLLGGAKFPLGPLTPFGELRIILIRSTSAFVVSGGVLF